MFSPVLLTYVHLILTIPKYPQLGIDIWPVLFSEVLLQIFLTYNCPPFSPEPSPHFLLESSNNDDPGMTDESRPPARPSLGARMHLSRVYMVITL